MSAKLFFFIFILFFSIDCYGQPKTQIIPTAQFTTVNIIQPSNSKVQPSITVVYETGETEEIFLEKYTSREERDAGGKKISATNLDNQIKITAFLNKLATKGYSLKDMDFEVSSQNTKYTAYIFEKISLLPSMKNN